MSSEKTLSEKEHKWLSAIKAGLLTKNPLFVTGLVLSAAVFTSDSLKTAAVTALCFTLITAVTCLFVNILPLSKTPYTVRIILYILIASCVYVPVELLSNAIFPSETAEILTYIQCMVTNSLILERFDKRTMKKKSQKILFILFAVLGFDIALMLFAFLREILAYGSIYGNMAAFGTPLPVFGYVFGGFLLLGIISGLYRFLLHKSGVH
jgi:Na+-transporting NADH:ubiquinone oxidoreductase subunit NqrD